MTILIVNITDNEGHLYERLHVEFPDIHIPSGANVAAMLHRARVQGCREIKAAIENHTNGEIPDDI